MSEETVALLPCPFCGGPAETDSRQAYRALSGGQIGHAAAIYCTGACSTQMTLCHADVSHLTPEDALAVLVENWNRRAAPETAAIPADAQVIPGRLGHAEWCPASDLPSCRCGAAEPAFDAFGQPKPCRPALKATVCPKDECAAGEFPHRRGAKGTCIYCGSPMNGTGEQR